jgi:ATP-dependent DNA helicase RecQ
VLRGGGRVMMRREVAVKARLPKARTATPGAAQAAEMPTEAAPVFEKLRTWRAAVAKEQGMPAYVIFHDATLRAIATMNPSTLAELGTVSGVGQSKLAKFGQQVLDTLHDASETGPAPAAIPGGAAPSRADMATPTAGSAPALTSAPASNPRSAARQRASEPEAPELFFDPEEEPPDEYAE